jgi:hypothetical protein
MIDRFISLTASLFIQTPAGTVYAFGLVSDLAPCPQLSQALSSWTMEARPFLAAVVQVPFNSTNTPHLRHPSPSAPVTPP